MRFPTFQDVAAFYADPTISAAQKHAVIYQEFGVAVHQLPDIVSLFQKTDGFGELPFCWHWYLAVQQAPASFRFLEVGVYKGRVLAVMQALANHFKKEATLVGVTPLSGDGDKYSGYEPVDYFAAIQRAFSQSGLSFGNTQLIKGFSQDPITVMEAEKQGLYDIVYIDGCHDYPVVVQDIQNYIPMLKVGGLFVMDDASLFLEAPAGQFKGHPDVGAAIRDVLDNRADMEHVYAVGHNRVWRKKE